MLPAPYDISMTTQQEGLMLSLTGNGSQRVLRNKRNGGRTVGLAPKLLFVHGNWAVRLQGCRMTIRRVGIAD